MPSNFVILPKSGAQNKASKIIGCETFTSTLNIVFVHDCLSIFSQLMLETTFRFTYRCEGVHYAWVLYDCGLSD